MFKKKSLKKKAQILNSLDALDALDKDVYSEVNHQKAESGSKALSSPHFFEEFEKSLQEREFKVGDIVSGRILSFNEDFVVVDINYKSEGLIPLSEFHALYQGGEGQQENGFLGQKDREGSLTTGMRTQREGRRGERGFKGGGRKEKFRKKYRNNRSGGREESFHRRKLSSKEREELLKVVKVGSVVDVYIETIENESGRVVLSKDKADAYRVWNRLSRAVETGEVVEGLVEAKVKGGLSIDVGMKAFLPGSQIDIRPVVDMDHYVGKRYKFKVIKFNKRRGNVVLSRRVLLAEERESLRFQTLTHLKEGSIVKGVVKGITDYGAFIDLGGVDGLLHITDMSWGRIKHPSGILKEHQELDVMILKFDSEKNRVNLGLKQIRKDPWKSVEEKYPLGSRVKGKIMSVTDYGAFVELSEGVEGLIHVSEMSWLKRFKHPSQIVQKDQEVDVQVLEIDVKNRRISLGLKQLQANPWEELQKQYPVGSILEGEVRSVTDFGIFVGISEDVDGLVHISDFSWTRRITSPSDEFKKGDRVKVMVLGIDSRAERFSLGIKQLESNPWSEVNVRYPVGSRHRVKVIEATDFGVFVELEKGVEGLIHISELSTKRVEKTSDIVKIGESIEAEIISVDTKARKIGLSIKVIKLREQHQGEGNQPQAVSDESKKAPAAKGAELQERENKKSQPPSSSHPDNKDGDQKSGDQQDKQKGSASVEEHQVFEKGREKH